MNCSYDEYDKVEEIFEGLTPAGDYVPCEDQLIEVILPNLEDYLLFLLWVDLTGIKTQENADMRKMIHKVILQNVVLTEDENDTILPKKKKRKRKRKNSIYSLPA